MSGTPDGNFVENVNLAKCPYEFPIQKLFLALTQHLNFGTKEEIVASTRQ